MHACLPLPAAEHSKPGTKRCLRSAQYRLRCPLALRRLLATVPEEEMAKAQRVYEAISQLDAEAEAEEQGVSSAAAAQLEKLL